MRQPNKNRSRNNKNRNNNNNNNKHMGNVTNRVFDSAGPEGKVRGTPAQIIEKYQSLARDAQLSGDRVAAENFLQHTEHYTRLLGEAQREIDAQNAKREAEQEVARQEQAARDAERAARDAERAAREAERAAAQPEPQPAPVEQAQPVHDEQANLVETPEQNTPAPKPRRPRSRRASTKSVAPEIDAPQAENVSDTAN